MLLCVSVGFPDVAKVSVLLQEGFGREAEMRLSYDELFFTSCFLCNWGSTDAQRIALSHQFNHH